MVYRKTISLNHIERGMIKIHYLYHSGFALEIDETTLLIDFYQDSIPHAGYVYNTILKRENPLYIFSTHVHHDHFTKEIIDWSAKRENITYILSDDILPVFSKKSSTINYLGKGDLFNDQKVKVKAYGSTDAGVSFVIEIGNYKIFHAGDLNNWHWRDESSEAYSRQAEADFLRELSIIKEDYRAFDLVFFPVDNRMGSDYMRGAEQFLDQIQTNLFIPMHFSEEYAGGNAFKAYAEKKNTKFFTINKRGDSMVFEKK